jgi:hypothetical protein
VTEERFTSDSTGDAGDGSTGDSVESMTGKTVEEVEAFWRNRLSGEARAHNAETAVLQAQIADLKSAPAKPPEGETPEAARVRELEAELQKERAARQAEALRATYPMTAAVLGESITNLPPEKLAALEARYEGAPVAPLNDPNAAPRNQTGMPGGGAKPLNEKTKEELLAELKRATPAFQAAQREGLV